jgi:hypothetical protein
MVLGMVHNLDPIFLIHGGLKNENRKITWSIQSNIKS